MHVPLLPLFSEEEEEKGPGFGHPEMDLLTLFTSGRVPMIPESYMVLLAI